MPEVAGKDYPIYTLLFKPDAAIDGLYVKRDLLEAKIAEAQALTEADYSSDTWAILLT